MENPNQADIQSQRSGKSIGILFSKVFIFAVWLPIIFIIGISIFYFLFPESAKVESPPVSYKCIQGDCKNGKGIRVSDDGERYEGEFQNGMKHGFGKTEWADGGIYIGEYKNGYRDGKGTFNYHNGNKYIGEWKDNMESGFGKMIYADGRVEEGQWKDGQFIGK